MVEHADNDARTRSVRTQALRILLTRPLPKATGVAVSSHLRLPESGSGRELPEPPLPRRTPEPSATEPDPPALPPGTRERTLRAAVHALLLASAG